MWNKGYSKAKPDYRNIMIIKYLEDHKLHYSQAGRS